MTTQEFLSRLNSVRETKSHQWQAKCPSHEDDRPSLSISENETGLAVHCHAGCTADRVCGAIGLRVSDLFFSKKPGNGGNGKGLGRIVAVYPYHNDAGQKVYEVVRFDPKGFRARKPDGTYGVKGIPRIICHADEIHSRPGETVFICEGEKDSDNVRKLGLLATTNPFGSQYKWEDSYSESLRGRDCILLPHADTPGRKHMQEVAESLLRHDCKVRILELPGLHNKQDVSDWLTLGHTKDELLELAANTPPFNHTPKTQPIVSADEIKSEQLSELATAKRLRDHYGDALRHTRGLGWLAWDGKRWEMNEKGARRAVHSIGSSIRREVEAKGITDPKLAAAYFSHARTVESDYGGSAVLSVAESLEGLDGDRIQWDSHPWLLNCQNGAVDLRSGKLQPHRKQDFITKICPIEYDPTAQCPRWERFLNEIFQGSTPLINYMKWWLGYSLSGSTIHQVWSIFFGSGANGKSTLINIVQSILSEDYAQEVNPEELMLQKHARHTAPIAKLRGARFVSSVETSEGRRINESFVKALTGGDKLVANQMHKDPFAFVPELKLTLCTNHPPAVKDDSVAFWRRVRMFPFNVSFATNPDKFLSQTLRDESPGILSWMIDGAKEAATAEPTLPDEVVFATGHYQDSQDILLNFIEDECEVDYPGAAVTKTALYNAYYRWTNGRCEGKIKFGEKVRARGFQDSTGSGNVSQWNGISLKNKDLGNGSYF